ncbi:O-antigen ligase family protein [Candidatus Peregrinibacteria bacterium]|nr:O-antigen ligase family protein [Candidatus Peregrinibacteria bacterium]
MIRIIFGIVLLVEVFALANRGGGPLLSHLFLTGAAAAILVICYLKKIQLRRMNSWPILSFAAFFIFFALSLLASLTPGYDLAWLLLFANAGLLFFIISSLEISEKDLRIFSIGLIGVAVADTLIGYFIYTQTAFPRFAGTFIDLAAPYTSFGNDYADFILLILPLALARFFEKHRRLTTTVVFGFAAAILFSGFLLSFSRAAWVSLFIVIILAGVWFFYYKSFPQNFTSPRRIFMRLAAGILLTVLLVTALQTVRSRKFQTTPLFYKALFQADEGSASVNERIDFWKGAVKLIAERPLFGSGVLSFKYLYPRYQEKFGANWDHPHNLFLNIGVENGIFAALFFMVFLGSIAVICARFLWKNPGHGILFFLLGSLGAFGHNLLDLNFIVSNFTLFIVFLAIGAAHARAAKSVQRLHSSIFILRFAMIASLLLVMLGLHEGFYNYHFKKGRAALTSGNLGEATLRLEKSKNLFFQRDLANYLSAAYKKQYESTRDIAWRQKEIRLLRETDQATLDAKLLSRLGEIYMDEKKYAEAENLFTRAINLDSSNNLKYYFLFLDAQKKQGKRTPPGMREKIKNLLAEYITILRFNHHMTILTDNPTYAGKLYDFFSMRKEREQLDAIWFEELIKFTSKYGKVPKSVL